MAVIEQRYAQALADLVAKGAIAADRLRRELAEAQAAVASSPGLRTVLGSPAVSWEKKLAVIEAVARGLGLAPLTRNFLLVAAQRGRMSLLGGMESAFERMLLEREGVVKADIASARVLEAGERAAIERDLARHLARKLQTSYRTDPALVGGFVARVGDQVYDGSVRGRLDRLRQNILAS